MPIRTGRGRAAVYRTLWGWPLRSPRHLAAVAAGVTVLAVLLGVVAARGPDGAATGSGPSATRAGSAGTDRAGGSAEGSVDGSADGSDAADGEALPGAGGAEAPSEALDAADGFVRAVTTTPDGLTTEEWVAQVEPYASEGLVPDLRTVDPANVPDGEVAGPPRTVSVGTGTAVVDVPTSAAILRVDLVDTPAGWRVTSYERAG